MSNQLIYKKLFSLKVVHHYFLDDGTTLYKDLSASRKDQLDRLYNIHDHLMIVPTRETKKILAGYRAIFKANASGFDVLIQADPSSTTAKAFIALSDNDRFRFHLIPRDPHFFNYTLLPLPNSFYTNKPKLSTYRYTNTGHPDTQAPNLPIPAPVFDSAAANAAIADTSNPFAYLTGDLVSDNAAVPTKVFEAQRSTNANTNTNTTSDWTELSTGNLFYANSADQIELYPSIYNLQLTTPDIIATVQVSDENGEDQFETPLQLSTAQGQLTHSIDLRHLAPGYYSMEISKSNGDPTIVNTFYLDDEIINNNIWGVVEITQKTGLSNYSLINDATKVLQSPAYVIHFKNRSTRWKYYNTQQALLHQSTGLVPLTQNGVVSQLFNTFELPNPNAEMIKPETAQLVSELFIQENSFT